MRIFIPIWLLLCCHLSLYGQEGDAIEYKKFPLKIGLSNHVVGFPFENISSTYNPHFSIGTERQLNKHLSHQFLAGSKVGWTSNKVIGNTISVDLDIGYRYMSALGLFSKLDFSIGAINQYHPYPIYDQKSNGTFALKKDRGRPSSLIGFKLGIGYDLSRRGVLPVAIGIEHHAFIQTSYFDVASFPIMPQTTSGIIITCKFRK